MINNIKTGLKPDSVENMVFGAGVLYKNFSYGTHYMATFDVTPQEGKTYYYLTGGPAGGSSYTEFTDETFNSSTTYYEKYEGFGGEKIGATKEGAKVSIIPEYTDIEIDGVTVKMEGLTRKTGEKATMEAVVVDMNISNINTALNGRLDYYSSEEITGADNVSYVETTSDIKPGDYIKNLAIAARRLDDGKLMIIVFKKALCTSGFEIDLKNKDVAGNKYKFEAFAEQSDLNTDTLPVVILTEENN